MLNILAKLQEINLACAISTKFCKNDQGSVHHQQQWQAKAAKDLRALGGCTGAELSTGTLCSTGNHQLNVAYALSSTYTLPTEDQQQAVVREIFSLLSKRSDAVCNFLEGGT